MPLTVVEYVREDGGNPYGQWFASLPAQAADKIAVARQRLEMGNTSKVKWIGVIGEYRIDWGPGYRIYLARDGGSLIILSVAERKKANIGISSRQKCCGPNTRYAKP